MLEFYKKALLGLLGLLVASILAAYVCLERTFLHMPLLPMDVSGIPWHSVLDTDVHLGGLSSARVYDERYSLDFELRISEVAEYPFAAVVLAFEDETGQAAMADLSLFSSVSFSVKCSPANVLVLAVYTIDGRITQLDDLQTYRSPSAFFSCDEQWSRVELDLTRLETPQWWMDKYQLKLSLKDYKLDKVPQILLGSTFQSPTEVDARIQLNELTLHGRDWRYAYLLGLFLFLAWSGYGIWFFRQHTRALIGDLRTKIQKDRPLVAYQQLSVEPQRDKDKGAILRFMATGYANPDINLESMVTSIGVSRTKINDILKAELGFTFTGYLNKLRLTEAARLLAEKEEANIAEIAYSVGYKNVSYFNKLFKEEYGCTPKAFKGIYDRAYLDSEK